MGTYVSRMGLCFSTSLDAVGISIDQGAIWGTERDVKSDDGKYCFSDGVGRISQDLASEVWTPASSVNFSIYNDLS